MLTTCVSTDLFTRRSCISSHAASNTLKIPSSSSRITRRPVSSAPSSVRCYELPSFLYSLLYSIPSSVYAYTILIQTSFVLHESNLYAVFFAPCARYYACVIHTSLRFLVGNNEMQRRSHFSCLDQTASLWAYLLRPRHRHHR